MKEFSTGNSDSSILIKILFAICLMLSVAALAINLCAYERIKNAVAENSRKDIGIMSDNDNAEIGNPKPGKSGIGNTDVGNTDIGNEDIENAEIENTEIENMQIKRVALTFDDGPHPKYTKKLLDGLKERGIKATFFVTGENAGLYRDIIERMHREGHLIGNHTYSHMQLSDNNRDKFEKELIKTNELIKSVTGEDVEFVRPPYGTWDKSFEKKLNMFPVLWDVDSLDWCTFDSAHVARDVLANTKEEDIILMHDCYDTTVEAALMIADELINRGFSFVTVDEILFD